MTSRPLGTIIEDLCVSDVLGLPALNFREGGLWNCCSDSEELEAMKEELDIVGNMLRRMSWLRVVEVMTRIRITKRGRNLGR
jgi:hypothetical protein